MDELAAGEAAAHAYIDPLIAALGPISRYEAEQFFTPARLSEVVTAVLVAAAKARAVPGATILNLNKEPNNA
jgi:hypothetical protein